jgi:capsular polysaccharide transport system permease protein
MALPNQGVMAVGKPRSPLSVMCAVWKAIFLREALRRLFGARAAWLWVFLEPVYHIGFIMLMFAVIRVRVIGGIDTQLWIMVGLLAFFMFRRPAQQAMDAIGANQGLLAFRQVQPIDTIVVRAGLEGCTMLVISLILCTGANLYGLPGAIPADPLTVILAVVALWLLGVGFGMIVSVLNELLPEIGKMFGLLLQPLYLFSGIIFPIASFPEPYRGWLLFNPIAHGLEAVRLGFAPHYRAVAELSVSYMYGCAAVLLFFGLALQYRYAPMLSSR